MLNKIWFWLTTHPLYFSMIAAACFAGFGFIPLMGLPGGLVYLGVKYVATDTLGLFKIPELTGDQAWPAALLATILWPLAIIPGAYVGWSLLPPSVPSWQRWLTLGGFVLLGMVLATLFVAHLVVIAKR